MKKKKLKKLLNLWRDRSLKQDKKIGRLKANVKTYKRAWRKAFKRRDELLMEKQEAWLEQANKDGRTDSNHMPAGPMTRAAAVRELMTEAAKKLPISSECAV